MFAENYGRLMLHEECMCEIYSSSPFFVRQDFRRGSKTVTNLRQIAKPKNKLRVAVNRKT